MKSFFIYLEVFTFLYKIHRVNNKKKKGKKLGVLINETIKKAPEVGLGFKSYEIKVTSQKKNYNVLFLIKNIFSFK